jgi:hypothetical protein
MIEGERAGAGENMKRPVVRHILQTIPEFDTSTIGGCQVTYVMYRDVKKSSQIVDVPSRDAGLDWMWEVRRPVLTGVR